MAQSYTHRHTCTHQPSGTSASPRRWRTLRSACWVVATAFVVASCGGGGGGGGNAGPIIEPPSNLVYSAPSAEYRTDGAINPNIPSADGDPITSWAVAPALPPGLMINAGSGAIEGTPVEPMDQTTFVVTAGNSGGETTASVDLTIKWVDYKSMAPMNALTDDDLRHFLERTHFGFSDFHYTELVNRGLAAYVDLMTTFFDQPQLEADVRAAYLVDTQDPEGRFPASWDITRWWTALCMGTVNPFQEKLALHWHDHFACSSEVLGETTRYTMVNQINLWRQEGAGNARDLILAMTRDWAMLEFLDGVESTKVEPNENFGREYFELYCLGVDNHYTEADIVEAARAFTGYKLEYDTNTGQSYVLFDPDLHDPDEKWILGSRIAPQNAGDDYAEVVDITLAFKNPHTGVSAVAEWLCRSLLRHFCMDDPTPELVDQMARMLESNWELKPVLMALFQSEAFYSLPAKEGIVKTPMEQFLGFMRSTGLIGDPTTMYDRMQRLGNFIGQPPTVDGWPEGTAWFSAQDMVERANLINYFAAELRSAHETLGIDVADLLPAGTPTSDDVVDALAKRLRLELSVDDHTLMATYLEQDRDFTGTVVNDPWDPTDDVQIDKKVRGLLYIMSQHPTYLTR